MSCDTAKRQRWFSESDKIKRTSSSCTKYSSEATRWPVIITILLFINASDTSSTSTTATPIVTAIDPFFNLNYHGYHDKKNVPAKWIEWLNEWKMKINAKKENYSNDMNDGRRPDWVGVPEGGVNPPPWAIMPTSENNKSNSSWSFFGVPRFCFSTTARGNCTRTLKRWAFIPHKSTCEQFIYSGCGRNSNNFLHKQHCMDRCGSTVGGCCGGFYEDTLNKNKTNKI